MAGNDVLEGAAGGRTLEAACVAGNLYEADTVLSMHLEAACVAGNG